MAFARISKNTLSSKSDKRPKMHCKPSGFPASKEENTVNGKLIFQRCHLIGFRLFKIRGDKDENANLKKVFTGTRFMNNLMLYYENKIHETEKTVLYRLNSSKSGKLLSPLSNLSLSSFVKIGLFPFNLIYAIPSYLCLLIESRFSSLILIFFTFC